jgi:asparagine synthase (glutamine-hydrolysing)
VRLTRLEAASGTILGHDVPTVLPTTRISPRNALEQTVRRALEHPPCIVAFSGGRDSSAVLALAAHVARRDGLAPPVPVSVVFPGHPEAGEDRWQELVVRHLGLDAWLRRHAGDELDVLGDLARDGLRRHGLQWPPNAHLVGLVAREAAGGAVLTGFDGDGLFDERRWWRAAGVLGRTARPTLRDLPAIALALSPIGIRARAQERRAEPGPPWLRPAPRGQVERDTIADAVREPLRWRPFVAWYAASRYVRLASEAVTAFAADHGAVLVQPFADPVVLAALAADSTRFGYPDRVTALTELVGDLLPSHVIEREEKADFTRAMFGPSARTFAAEWDGRSAPLDLVSSDAARSEWLRDAPDFCSWTLLQACWLAEELGVGFDGALEHRRRDAGSLDLA